MMENILDRLVQYYRKRGPVVLLESQSSAHPASRISYLAALPEASVKAWGSRIKVAEKDSRTVFEDNPWDALARYRQKWGDWLLGYLGYDLKNHLEVLHSANPDVLNVPDLYFIKPGVLLRIDQKNETIKAIKGEIPDNVAAYNIPADFTIQNLHSPTAKEQYLSIIDKAQNRIYEGEYYEINLSHQLQAEFSGSSFQLYRLMRQAGPVPFGAFIQFDDVSVCSFSPERFLRKEGRNVFSQPIKGTMKRDGNAERDEQLRQKLIESVKNKAENLMIVDLVRNDLSRIARPGSVDVPGLFEIQTFGTVHQMVSTVNAETSIENPLEIIKACYPMGSMTGAPKISAMQSIEELENYRRGIYSGAIGYLTPRGDFDFNVVIRSVIIKNGRLCYGVGGAITGDSIPDEEWQETWLKAKALTGILDFSLNR